MLTIFLFPGSHPSTITHDFPPPLTAHALPKKKHSQVDDRIKKPNPFSLTRPIFMKWFQRVYKLKANATLGCSWERRLHLREEWQLLFCLHVVHLWHSPNEVLWHLKWKCDKRDKNNHQINTWINNLFSAFSVSHFNKNHRPSFLKDVCDSFSGELFWMNMSLWCLAQFWHVFMVLLFFNFPLIGIP